MGCSASKEKKGQRVQPSKVQVKEHEGVKEQGGVTAGVPQPVRPSKEGPAWDEHDHLVSTVAPPPPSAVAGGAAYLSIPLFASANRTKPSYPVSAGAAQPGAAGAVTSTTTVSPPPPPPPATGAKVAQVAINGAIDALAAALAARWISPKKLLDVCDEDGSGDMDLHEFQFVLQDLRVELTDHAVHDVFDAIDSDHSGSVSRDELESALHDKVQERIEAAAHAQPDTTGTAYENPALLPKLKLVSLVAHNNMKPAMMAFVASHLWFFRTARIITTGSTGKALEQKLGLQIDTKVSSGPLGGDQEIGGRISQGEVGIVFFFRDPLSAHPHDADINALCRLCDVHDCTIATNPSTAAAVMAALLKMPVGTTLPLAEEAELEFVAELAGDHEDEFETFSRPKKRESMVVQNYKSQQSAVINNVASNSK